MDAVSAFDGVRGRFICRIIEGLSHKPTPIPKPRMPFAVGKTREESHANFQAGTGGNNDLGTECPCFEHEPDPGLVQGWACSRWRPSANSTHCPSGEGCLLHPNAICHSGTGAFFLFIPCETSQGLLNAASDKQQPQQQHKTCCALSEVFICFMEQRHWSGNFCPHLTVFLKSIQCFLIYRFTELLPLGFHPTEAKGLADWEISIYQTIYNPY